MGIEPGSVSPYGLLNDIDNIVEFFLEEELYESDKLNFHPLINTATVTTKTSDFIDFMVENKKKNVEQKIHQMKQNALREIKNISVKISIETVENLVKKSIDKNKLEKFYSKSLEEAKTELKQTRS